MDKYEKKDFIISLKNYIINKSNSEIKQIIKNNVKQRKTIEYFYQNEPTKLRKEIIEKLTLEIEYMYLFLFQKNYSKPWSEISKADQDKIIKEMQGIGLL